MEVMISCSRCGDKTPLKDSIEQGSQRICEDCAMTLMSPAKACDPWAVKMAKSSFKSKNDAVKSLSGLELKIYELVSSKGRVGFDVLPEILGTTKQQVERAVATLRHMELVRGDKRPDGGADCVHFDSQERALL